MVCEKTSMTFFCPEGKLRPGAPEVALLLRGWEAACPSGVGGPAAFSEVDVCHGAVVAACPAGLPGAVRR